MYVRDSTFPNMICLDGSAAGVTEGNAFSEIDFDFSEVSFSGLGKCSEAPLRI